MLAKLVSGQSKWSFDTPKVVLGRSRSSDIRVEDNQASRFHTQLRLNAQNRYMALDFGSRNGTFLNGRLLTQPTQLNSGDVIRIGCQEFIFHGDENDEVKPTGIVLANTEPGRPFSIIGMAVRLVEDSEVLRNNLLKRNWAIGSWFQRQEEAVEKNGGVLDHVGQDYHFSYWEADAMQARELTPRVVQCLRDCLSATQDITTETLAALEMPLDTPLIHITAALHHGQAFGSRVGNNETGYFSMSGDCADLCLEMLKNAEGAPCRVVCTERLQSLLMDHSVAHPFTMAQVGPRGQSVLLCQMTI